MGDLSKYFSTHELECNCCRELPAGINLEFVLKELDNLRSEFDKPVYITSGYRCEDYNRSVGGHPNSAHMDMLAVDIAVENDSDREFLLYLILSVLKAEGIGIHKDFIHIDWKKRSHGKQVCFVY